MKLVSLIVASCFVATAIGFASTSAAQSSNCPPGQVSNGGYCQKKAPGQYCKDLNVPKTKLPGHSKTQFAECVTAMAKLDKKPSLAPSQACAASKQLKGKFKTKKNQKKANRAFSRCVQAGKKLKLDRANS